MNKKLLRSQMAKYGDTDTTLAAVFGKSQQAISAKINSRSKFTLDEIQIIMNRYSLSMDDVHEIFFA